MQCLLTLLLVRLTAVIWGGCVCVHIWERERHSGLCEKQWKRAKSVCPVLLMQDVFWSYLLWWLIVRKGRMSECSQWKVKRWVMHLTAGNCCPPSWSESSTWASVTTYSHNTHILQGFIGAAFQGEQLEAGERKRTSNSEITKSALHWDMIAYLNFRTKHFPE